MLDKTFAAPASWQLSDGTLLALGLTAGDYAVLFIAAAILIAVSVLQERGMRIRERVLSLPVLPRVILLYAFMYFVVANIVTAGGGDAGFMYAIF